MTVTESRVSDDDLVTTLRRMIAERGHPPTLRELSREVGCSPSTAHKRLGHLTRARRVAGSGRALRVIEPDPADFTAAIEAADPPSPARADGDFLRGYRTGWRDGFRAGAAR